MRQLSIVLAVDRGSASGRVHQPEQDPQCGRLARSVRTKKARHRTGADLEGQVVNCDGGPEFLAQRLDDDLAHRLAALWLVGVTTTSTTSTPATTGTSATLLPVLALAGGQVFGPHAGCGRSLLALGLAVAAIVCVLGL